MSVLDAVIVMRSRPVRARPLAIPESIGLQADPEGEGTRVQWNRRSRPIRNADYGILFIEDGQFRKQLPLTGRELDGSTVRYWPEAERVVFRLDVYRGDRRSTDSATFLPSQASGRPTAGTGRLIVEQLRPSPFERAQPEIVVTQTRPAPVIPVAALEPLPTEASDESRLSRILSKIPLLRRLQSPPSNGTEPRR